MKPELTDYRPNFRGTTRFLLGAVHLALAMVAWQYLDPLIAPESEITFLIPAIVFFSVVIAITMFLGGNLGILLGQYTLAATALVGLPLLFFLPWPLSPFTQIGIGFAMFMGNLLVAQWAAMHYRMPYSNFFF